MKPKRACISTPGRFDSLCQIRRGYRTEWNHLAISVETDSSQWTLRIQRAGENLYMAHRATRDAAKTAALEFAIFLLLGAMARESPERLARTLAWTEYW